MTPKEFIDENYFSLTIDCKREINEIYQALKDYAKTEQLTLTDVSQQSELLNFLKWYDEDLEYNSKQTHEQLILSYAQKFNCG